MTPSKIYLYSNICIERTATPKTGKKERKYTIRNLDRYSTQIFVNSLYSYMYSYLAFFFFKNEKKYRTVSWLGIVSIRDLGTYIFMP